MMFEARPFTHNSIHASFQSLPPLACGSNFTRPSARVPPKLDWPPPRTLAAMAGKGFNQAFSISKKYTQGSTGIWETLRKFFAVDPNRSNGIPVKHFRNPPPGGLDPNDYDDPTTVPAADIADNPYWKRDVRRNYPKLSSVTQADAVGLLTVGSAAAPSPKLLAGDEGKKQLVAVKEEGQKGLSAYFETNKGTGVLREAGIPPMPVSVRSKLNTPEKYEIGEEQGFQDKYPCRTFV